MEPKVTGLKLKKTSKALEVTFANGDCYELSCEFLRVHSPSAEVRGHGSPKLVSNKKDVNIARIDPVGGYAVKLTFDDGHDTGIYSWEILHELGRNQVTLWQSYLEKLKQAKATREPLIPLNVQFSDPAKK